MAIQHFQGWVETHQGKIEGKFQSVDSKLEKALNLTSSDIVIQTHDVNGHEITEADRIGICVNSGFTFKLKVI